MSRKLENAEVWMMLWFKLKSAEVSTTMIVEIVVVWAETTAVLQPYTDISWVSDVFVPIFPIVLDGAPFP